MNWSRTPGAEGLGPVAIAVIVVLGTALAMMLSLNLRSQQDTEVGSQVASRAIGLSRLGVTEIDRLYADLQRRAALWATLPESDGTSARVETFMAENPSVVALAFPATDESARGAREAVALLRTWQAEDHPPDAILGPVSVGDGRQLLGAYLRISYLAAEQRSILAVFDPNRLLSALFFDAAGDYGFALSLNGREIVHSDAPAPSDDLAAFAKEAKLSPRFGEPWKLSVWPTPDAIPRSYRQGPLVALAGGVLASGLIAVALHLGAVSWKRARILAEANAVLEEKIHTTEREHGELEKLRTALEVRVAERTAELNDTIADLQTFNYSVSHDLRSPLAAIINFAAIFQDDYAGRLDETQAEYLQRIIGSATSAVGLMDALLSYSQSGRTDLRRAHLNVTRLVREICDEATAAWPDRPCEMKIGTLPNAFADDSMLRSVFANLVSNACKFVKPGETARVQIDGHVDGAEVVYSVRDEGIGFDPRFDQKLFKAFERLHSSSEFEGHGIGLAIVARMVRRHGGRLWAQGAVGKGATFSFTIPIPDEAENGKQAT